MPELAVILATYNEADNLGRLGESKLDMRQVIKGVLFCVSSIFMYRLRLGRFSRP